MLSFQLIRDFKFGFEDGVLYLGYECKHSLIAESEQQIYLNFAARLTEPATIDEMFSFCQTNLNLTQAKADQLISLFFNQRWLMSAGVIHKSQQFSRNYAYFNHLGHDPRLMHQTLKQKKVAILGAGSIGNYIALHLVNLGIGKLTLIDHDDIEISNITRQALFTLVDVGKKKSAVLKNALLMRNPDVEITTLDRDEELTERHDLIMIASDIDPAARQVNLAELAHQHQCALFQAGYLGKYINFGPLFIPDLTICYACYLKQGRVLKTFATHSELIDKVETIKKYQIDAAIGPLAALSASYAALDIIKYLTGIPEIMSVGKEHRIDLASYEHKINEFFRVSGCKYCNLACA